MTIERILRDLGRPSAYPHGPSDVELRQTHISAVFLAGPLVYKVKKPVELDFLDFSSLEKRRFYCEEEVRLNRRLAPDVYLGVVPVAEGADDRLRVEGDGAPVDFAVKMRRLPDAATLEARLKRGELRRPTLEELGRRIAGFHRAATTDERIAGFGAWDVVASNARENLEQSRGQVGITLSARVMDRLSGRLEARLDALRDLIESRAQRGVPRDTHGDLHLDHVYRFPDREPPDDLVVIDCIEFNERFRYADPVSDMAFLAMDLRFRGRYELERSFSEAYFRAADDSEGRRLLPLYRSYRAAVRGKVEGMAAAEEEVSEEERRAALRGARGYWLRALSELEPPGRRPGMVLVGGLPGTGKSTLAGALAREAGFEVISSDRVRKELAGLDPDASAAADFEEGIYSAEWTRRTYRVCRERVRERLFQGERVLVDASFRSRRSRRAFLDEARGLSVRHALILCRASPRLVRRRMEERDGGASDADWSIYRRVSEAWEPVRDDPLGVTSRISTEGPLEQTLTEAMSHLRTQGLTA